MTPTILETMKQTLAAMQDHGTAYLNHEAEYATAIDCLRAAIKAMEDEEPVAWMYTDRKGWKQANFEGTHDLYECTPLYTHPAPAVPEKAEAEPVAWRKKLLCESETGETYEEWKYSELHSKGIPLLKGAEPLYTHPTPTIPDGWQIVPREPTAEMEQAGWDVEELVTPDKIYRAMLAAAPQMEDV